MGDIREIVVLEGDAMTDDQKYLFDLGGYLVIENVLTPEEVASCNQAIDHHIGQRTVAAPERVLSEESKSLAGSLKQYYLSGMLDATPGSAVFAAATFPPGGRAAPAWSSPPRCSCGR